ncbi:MAG: hypothetical protein ACE145_12600 [Terriglobia bacterium]
MAKLGELLLGWKKQAQRMFHVIVGLVFLMLTFAGATVSITEWQYYQRSPSQGLLRFGLLASFTVLLFIFCLYSFLKARSVR